MKEMKTADEILLRHFELAKKKYPEESWKKFDEVIIEREFVSAAMKEYAKQWIDRATDELNDVGVGFPEAYKRVMELKKEIDAQ